jgi:hypothetical protein
MEVAEMHLEFARYPPPAEPGAAAEMRVEIGEHAAVGRTDRKRLQDVEPAGGEAERGQRADRGAGDRIDRNRFFLEDAQRADMRPPTCCSAAQRERDAAAMRLVGVGRGEGGFIQMRLRLLPVGPCNAKT